jgi:hypothetical protein
MGGAYHCALLELSGFAIFISFAFAIAFAWIGTRHVVEGSVACARMRELLPAYHSIVIATTGWFIMAESLEPVHATAPIALIMSALALASWLVIAIARGVLSLLARFTVAVRVGRSSPYPIAWVRRASRGPFARALFLGARYYARPPPIAVASRA